MTIMRRIYALLLRQFFVLRGSLPRIVTLVFWPTFNMMIWGFMNRFLAIDISAKQFVMASLLGATMIFAFAERGQLNVMLGFLEDVWSRNIGNILISPIRTGELMTGLILNGTFSSIVGVFIAMIICTAIFSFNILTLGWPILFFVLILLMTGWWVGLLLVSVIVRYGPSGEYFAWMVPFALIPFMGVYYPTHVLPGWGQTISMFLPPTYVFEALRQMLANQALPIDKLFLAAGMNIIYLLLACGVFVMQLNRARQRGGLLNLSE